MIDQALRLLFEEKLGPVHAELARLRAEMQRTREALGAGQWLSRSEAAKTLKVSIDTIDRRVADKSLRSRRIGRAVRVLIETAPSETEIAQLACQARRE